MALTVRKGKINRHEKITQVLLSGKSVSPQEIAEVFNQSGLIVKKKYEVRKPFLLNIDLVLTFEKSFDKTSVQTK